MKSILNQYKVYSHNNGKLVAVAHFQAHQYKEAIETCQAQQALFSMMNPDSTFKCFVTDISKKEIIVAEADKGDLDNWNNTNKGTGKYALMN